MNMYMSIYDIQKLSFRNQLVSFPVIRAFYSITSTLYYTHMDNPILLSTIISSIYFTLFDDILFYIL